jgi:hypothetical protein
MDLTCHHQMKKDMHWTNNLIKMKNLKKIKEFITSVWNQINHKRQLHQIIKILQKVQIF